MGLDKLLGVAMERGTTLRQHVHEFEHQNIGVGAQQEWEPLARRPEIGAGRQFDQRRAGRRAIGKQLR